MPAQPHGRADSCPPRGTPATHRSAPGGPKLETDLFRHRLKEGDTMPKEVQLVPYEPHMGADFVPYEAVEDQLYGADTTSSPEQSKDAEAPVPTQPK